MIICSKIVLINSTGMAVAIWGLSYANCYKNSLRLCFGLWLAGSSVDAAFVLGQTGAKIEECFLGEIYFQSKHLFSALRVS